jgi:arylsulfatase A-like enzyme
MILALTFLLHGARLAPPLLQPPQPGPPPPNVLVVILDDVADVDLAAVRASGWAPNIDALAAHGVAFETSSQRSGGAFANPSCRPTRASLYFGSWWISDPGANCGGATPPAPALDRTSIAELFPLGLSLLVGKWHVGPRPQDGVMDGAPLAHGFDAWRAGLAANPSTCGSLEYSDWLRQDDASAAVTSFDYQPEAMRDAFVEWWSTARGRKLGVLSIPLAHAPFHAPDPYYLPPGYPPPSGRVAEYHAMIAAYDFMLGPVLRALNPANTMVFVIGDNGTPTNAGGGPESKTTVYERGIRVPCIVAGPMVASPGRVSNALVHVGVDVYATIADYWNSAAATDGISLRAAIEGRPFDGHDYVLVGNDNPPSSADPSVAARSARYKLRRVLATGGEQFYDLALDPLENNSRLNDPAYAQLVLEHRVWLDANLP